MSKANLDYLAQDDSEFDRDDFTTTNDDDFERGSDMSWDEEDPFGLMANINKLTSKYYDAPTPSVKKVKEEKKIAAAASTTGMAKAG